MNLLDKNISTILEDNATNFPDQLAVAFMQHSIYLTWSELNEKVNQVARGLMAMGAGYGTHIAVWGTNTPEWYFTQLATYKIGGVLITINPEWKEAELAYALNQSDTEILIMMPGFKKQSNEKIYHYDYIKIFNNIYTPDNQKTRFRNLNKVCLISPNSPNNMISWDQMLEAKNQISEKELKQLTTQVSSRDLAMIQYTSGTTGFPKGAMLTQHSIINNANAIVHHMNINATDSICGPVPFYHCFGSILLNLGALLSGAALVIPSDIFSPGTTLKALVKYDCTALYGVPTMFITQLEHPDIKMYKKGRLRTGIIAGAPVDDVLYQSIAKVLGAKEMTIAYGLTEASPVTHQTYFDDPVEKKINSVGKPLLHTESKIVDPETGEKLPDGEKGEIWVKGFHVMQGYYKKPRESKDTIIDGWLRTGDLGFKDPEGYFHISGRLKDLIIVGGHNVYPAEVEQLLYEYFGDKIEILQVIGVPHPKLQEAVAMVCQCLPGKTITLKEIKNTLQGKVEWPKVPKYLKLIPDFSNFMTVSGKIQKFKLRKMLQQELSVDLASSAATV